MNSDDRAARKAARALEKKADAERLASLRIEARALTKRMPAEYQSWGVVRTRAFAKLSAVTRHKAELRRIKTDRLAAFVDTLKLHESWSLEYCQQLSDMSETARSLP